MHHFKNRRLVSILCTLGILSASTQATAAAFQLWEQDAASIGNYHAGYAASAEDASTTFYNPAGLTRFKNQQAVFAGVGVMPNFKFKGDVTINSIGGGLTPFPVTAQGGAFGFIPALSYVAPISDIVAFGFSINVPFGLKTSYGQSTELRYVATQTSVTVVDYSPSLGFKITDKASFGLGLDIQTMNGEFDQVGTADSYEFDSNGINKAEGSGYGGHFGALYEFSPDSRIGISYHTQSVHHLSGTSSFTGPIPTLLNDGPIESRRATIKMTLPAYTALSMYQRVNPKLALMGSAIFTQWNVLKTLNLQNAAGIDNDFDPSTNINIIIPQYFRNSWNLAVGANYNATDDIMLRSGIGIDQTPVTSTYRNVQMPDNNRFVIALGSHYQASKTIGMDVSWNHLFIHKAHVIPPQQVTGSQITTTNGSVTGGADVLGVQLTWDIA